MDNTLSFSMCCTVDQTALLETDDIRQILKLVCEAFRVNMDHFKIYGDYSVNLSEANHILASE